MKNRLSSRLRLTLSGVTLLTLLLMCVLVFAGMYFQTTADNREQLRQQAVQLSSYLDASDDPVSLLHGSVFTQRVTYLDTDGTVLYDNETPGPADGITTFQKIFHSDIPSVRAA